MLFYYLIKTNKIKINYKIMLFNLQNNKMMKEVKMIKRVVKMIKIKIKIERIKINSLNILIEFII